MSILRFKRNLWVFFVYIFLNIRFYTWYKFLDLVDYIKFKTHRRRYTIKMWVKELPIIKRFYYGTVLITSENLVDYIGKYIKSGKDLSDFKFIRKVDSEMSKIQKHILKNSVYLNSFVDKRDIDHWGTLAKRDMDEDVINGETTKLAIVEGFCSRLSYLSDRMGFDRFIHLQMLWYYARSRLLFVPSENGKFNEETDSFDKDVIPTWEDN